MDYRLRVDGVNNFLTEIYDPLMDIPTLFIRVGIDREKITRLDTERLERLLAEYSNLVQTRIKHVRKDGPRLARILCRRYAFDGMKTATLQELGDEFGLSRERIRQLELKALRSCRSIANRRFSEEGLRHFAATLDLTTLDNKLNHDRIDSTAMESPTSSNAPSSSPYTGYDQVSAHPDDIEFVANLATIVLQQIPAGLGHGMLSHVLAGSKGPVVHAVVQHYGLAQYGILKPVGFSRVKDLVRLACSTEPRFLCRNNQIQLAPHYSESSILQEAVEVGYDSMTHVSLPSPQSIK